MREGHELRAKAGEEDKEGVNRTWRMKEDKKKVEVKKRSK